MFSCTTATYDRLYARWLEKPGALLDWAGFDPLQHDLLDLCGGTGAVAKEALARGAKQVWLLDLNPRANDPRITSLPGKAEDSGAFRPPAISRVPPWNLVVCRQSLGYLDLVRVERNLREVVRPGGRFVTNTFVRPRFSVKAYRHGGAPFLEASAWLGRRVVHLQATVGDLDVTSFRWHTREQIFDAFRSGWRTANFKESPASLWFSFERFA